MKSDHQENKEKERSENDQNSCILSMTETPVKRADSFHLDVAGDCGIFITIDNDEDFRRDILHPYYLTEGQCHELIKEINKCLLELKEKKEKK